MCYVSGWKYVSIVYEESSYGMSVSGRVSHLYVLHVCYITDWKYIIIVYEESSYGMSVKGRVSHLYVVHACVIYIRQHSL